MTNALEKYQDNWICDKTLFRVISASYPGVINSVGFSRAAFNHAISLRASQCGTLHDSGIFVHNFQMPCLYESKKRMVFFYYRHVAGKPPASLLGPHDCVDVHGRASLIRLSTAKRKMTQPLSILPQSTDQRPNNRSDHGNKDNPNDGNKNKSGGNGGGGGGEEESGGNLGPIAVTPYRMIRRGGVSLSNKPVYWDSPEVAKLFGFNKGEDVYNKLGERVTLLKGAIQKPGGYKTTLQHCNEALNADQVSKIRDKCVFLIRAYQIALEKLGTNNTHWKKTAVKKR